MNTSETDFRVSGVVTRISESVNELWSLKLLLEIGETVDFDRVEYASVFTFGAIEDNECRCAFDVVISINFDSISLVSFLFLG